MGRGKHAATLPKVQREAVDQSDRVIVPAIIAEHEAMHAEWCLIQQRLSQRGHWTEEYQYVLEQLIITTYFLRTLQQRMMTDQDTKGILEDIERNLGGGHVVSQEGVTAQFRAMQSLQKQQLSYLQVLGMTPRDINYMYSEGLDPEATVKGQVVVPHVSEGITYFND